MKIDLNSLPINARCEYLRGVVFDQSQNKYGCYSTFEVNPGFVDIDPAKYPQIYDRIKPDEHCASDIRTWAVESETIVAMWWWDGDGNLSIWVKGEDVFYNNDDCKKDHIWKPLKIRGEL